ncbi:MAG TPA: histidine phosphatase family protein [Candidatus Binatia bacterium]
MKTRILLIRHGATVLSAEDRFAGSTDVELSDEGRRQARALAERLADDRLAAIYASPMRRALETASIVGRPHGLEPIVEPGLREIGHGHWEGLTRKEVEQRFAEEYAAWELDPVTFAPRGGEPGVAVMARALPVIRTLVERHAGATVAVVSHKATIRLVLAALLGIEPRGYRDRLDQAPACLNVVDFKDPVRARLMLYNDVSHYADTPSQPTGQLSKWWDER